MLAPLGAIRFCLDDDVQRCPTKDLANSVPPSLLLCNFQGIQDERHLTRIVRGFAAVTRDSFSGISSSGVGVLRIPVIGQLERPLSGVFRLEDGGIGPWEEPPRRRDADGTFFTSGLNWQGCLSKRLAAGSIPGLAHAVPCLTEQKNQHINRCSNKEQRYPTSYHPAY